MLANGQASLEPVPGFPSQTQAFSPSKRSPRTARPAVATTVAPSRQPAAARRSCVVEFRSGEAVVCHPQLKCYLDDGWFVESAVPSLTHAGNVELLVVLSRSRGREMAPAADDDL